jgi:ribosomal protein S18 acetylase RimI-like enzyme
LAKTTNPLDNPIWQALVTAHANYAEGDELAKRYPMVFCPLAAIRSPSAEAYNSLARLVQPEEGAGLLMDDPPTALRGWELRMTFPLAQMTGESKTFPLKAHPFVELGADDAPAMLDLCQRTHPGPFAARTHELGTYLGIKVAGVLIAMAGERLRLSGFTEISAVCTDPEHAGRGYAQALVSELGRRIVARGETPFLHVRTDNARAIGIYERLGFRTRRHFHLAIMRTKTS